MKAPKVKLKTGAAAEKASREGRAHLWPCTVSTIQGVWSETYRNREGVLNWRGFIFTPDGILRADTER